MADEDRVALLRLSQQVEAIAHSLDRMGHASAQSGAGLAEFKRDYHAPEAGLVNSFAGPCGGDAAPLVMMRVKTAPRRMSAIHHCLTIRSRLI